MAKNKAASDLAKLRWSKVPKGARRKVARALNAARWGKKKGAAS
jgi:hypothetical protein